MRHHYSKPKIYISAHGRPYPCDHPAYSLCTLYLDGGLSLAVIQQRFDPETKSAWWADIDPWLTDDIYLHPRFPGFFKERAGKAEGGLYPTVSVRQLMWALRMKPLKRERWETAFDRRDI